MEYRTSLFNVTVSHLKVIVAVRSIAARPRCRDYTENFRQVRIRVDAKCFPAIFGKERPYTFLSRITCAYGSRTVKMQLHFVEIATCNFYDSNGVVFENH